MGLHYKQLANEVLGTAWSYVIQQVGETAVDATEMWCSDTQGQYESVLLAILLWHKLHFSRQQVIHTVLVPAMPSGKAQVIEATKR